MSEYIVRMPPDMPYEIRAELNAWYVESEPIVRCRDCKYVTADQSDHDFREPLWCSFHRMDVRLDGFCAWGERREP